ncbi:hypothetical protein [Salmonirosea aquatica]|uniref:Uncharacterized protein n=1 Tax=Salmonirosea aquatica TaxID=2654236 RepID=A0A7C9BW53_9BACT|nr:hypothetical protein [Cytophagaceae bacterium SJW1-29]
MKRHSVKMVKKANENINKYHHDRLPDPEIPADEAWARMDSILGSDLTPVKGPGTTAKLLKYKWAFLSTCAVTIVSTVIFIKIAHHSSGKEGQNPGGTDTTGAAMAKNEKGARRTVHAPEPGKPNGIAIGATGPEPFQGHRNGAIASAAIDATPQTRKAGLQRLAESARPSESAVPEGHRAAKPRRNAKDARNSASWWKGIKPVNALKNHYLQNDRPLSGNGENSRGISPMKVRMKGLRSLPTNWLLSIRIRDRVPGPIFRPFLS